MELIVLVVWLVSAVIFVLCMSKKNRAQIMGGKDYATSDEYKEILKWQKISGIICIVLALVLGNAVFYSAGKKGVKEELTSEEKAQQELYDKQAQYEEWIAWKQQQAKEKADEAKAKHEQRRAQERAEREKYQPVSAYQMLDTLRENGLLAKERFGGRYVKVLDACVVKIETDGKIIVVNAGKPSYDYMWGYAVDYNQLEKSADLGYRYHLWCDVSTAKGIGVSSLRKGQWIALYAQVKGIDENGYYIKVNSIDMNK